MTAFVIVLAVLAALATLGVLIKGIITMASGKDVTGRQSNKLMSYRVALQFTAIALFLIVMALKASQH